MYTESQGSRPHDIIEISSEANNKSDKFEDIEFILTRINSRTKPVPTPLRPEQVFNSTFKSTIESTSNSAFKSTVITTFELTSYLASRSSPELVTSVSKSTFKSTISSTSNSAVLSLSSLTPRQRKLTLKQASQNRRAIEKEEKRLARLARKLKAVDTT